ncbi:MAG TPA: family 43 glycosylhydrolase [Polyangiales bacterium]
MHHGSPTPALLCSWLLALCAGFTGCTADSTDPSDMVTTLDAAALPGDAAALEAQVTTPEGGSTPAGPRDASLDAGPPNAQEPTQDGSASLDAASADAGHEASAPEAGSDTDANRPDAGTDAALEAGAAGDRCDVANLDPAQPPRVLTLSGNLGTHDPALIEQDGTFYLFQTGPRIFGKTSTNLMSWQGTPSALGGANPAWIAREVPGATDLWAPDIAFFGGQYHLYYSASTFGSNSSCMGHATRASLSSGSFSDKGSVLCSNHGSRDDWNAIDPNVVLDEAGAPWLFFGSFWSGIKAAALNMDGSRKDNVVHAVASRNGGAIEAPFVVRRCGYFYLFVSFDKCCSGADSTYNIRVGRSLKVLGPYVDKSGMPMMNGGGTLLVSSAGRWRGPGHNAVLFSQKRAYNVYHAYDTQQNGASMLRVAELAWDKDGWPVSGGP